VVIIFGGNEFVGWAVPGFGWEADVPDSPAKANEPPRKITAKVIADLR
jgi:hypothetical protein